MGDTSNIDITWRSALMLAVCAPLLMAAIMLFFRRVERAANIWLGLFLLFVAIAQIPSIIGFSGFYTVWPGLTFAPFYIELYAGPLLYLHADRLMREGPMGWRKFLLVPGLMQTFYYSWAFLTLGDYKAKWAYTDSIHVPYVEPIETLIGIGLILFAIVAIIRLMRRYHQFLENTQSTAREFNPVWLKRLILATVAASGVLIALEVAPIFIGPVSFMGAYPAEALITVIVAWLGFEALSKTSIGFPKMSDLKPIDSVPSMSERDWVEEGATLKNAVEQGGWYLQPGLSLRDLAKRLGSNETYISRAINQGLGMSFNAFVNGLRVENAKMLMNTGNMNMLEISHASGFNSKATFNRVFREAADMTPSAYKKAQIK